MELRPSASLAAVVSGGRRADLELCRKPQPFFWMHIYLLHVSLFTVNDTKGMDQAIYFLVVMSVLTPLPIC